MNERDDNQRAPRRFATALLVGVGTLLLSAAPVGAHEGSGDVAVGHVCIDSAGGYHLADTSSASTCPPGQIPAHLAATQIEGPQLDVVRDAPTSAPDLDVSADASGAAGMMGPQGPSGPTGPAGPPGPPGPAGTTGLDGLNGLDGAPGLMGPQGPAGSAGPGGPTGPTGAAGSPGAAGSLGPTGPMGPSGPRGTSGRSGPTGPTGPTGPSGPSGIAGPVVRAGAGAPAAVSHSIGDYYLDTANRVVYGPKTPLGWGAPVSLSATTSAALRAWEQSAFGAPFAQASFAAKSFESTDFGGVRLQSAGQNAEITWRIPQLLAGTYTFDLYHRTGTDGGMYTIEIDGVQIGTVDGYAPAAETRITSLPSVVIGAGQGTAPNVFHTVRLVMATKHASSTDYIGRVARFALTRTDA